MDQAPGTAAGPSSPDPGDAAAQRARADGNGRAVLVQSSSTQAEGSPPGRAAPAVSGWRFQLTLLLAYLVAGVAVSWPRPSYLAGRLPATLDQSSYVWDFWWVTHQVTHLGNPWFTPQLAAPAGVQLGFDTLMPLPGVLMTPVTLLFGPSVSYNLLTIVVPGLACYAAYRAARLWLSTATGAIAAGALYGLATTLVWQDWYHLNVAAGAIFFPLALEASVRLRRRPSRRQAVILGVVLGASLLVNQESAIMAVLVAAPVLLLWLARSRSATALWQSALAAGVAAAVASPQIIAMAQQALAGGAALPAVLLAHQDTRWGVPLDSLFAPSPRAGDFGLTGIASFFHYQAVREGVPTFGVMLTVLAILGLVVSWKRSSARLLGLLWLGCAAMALGSVLRNGHGKFVPLPTVWHGVPMSAVLPYTWFVHIPGLAGFREPDRFTLLGLLPAAILAGMAVEWLRRRAPALLVAALALAVLEAGYSGSPLVPAMPTAIPRLDAPIAADRSHSIVVDVPFGLRGGLAFYGKEVSPSALVLATADGHPRAASDTSWVPATTLATIKSHVFYTGLVAAEQPGHVLHIAAAQVLAARQDALRMRVRWAIVWKPKGQEVRYLTLVGYRYRTRVGHARLFELTPARSG